MNNLLKTCLLGLALLPLTAHGACSTNTFTAGLSGVKVTSLKMMSNGDLDVTVSNSTTSNTHYWAVKADPGSNNIFQVLLFASQSGTTFNITTVCPSAEYASPAMDIAALTLNQ